MLEKKNKIPFKQVILLGLLPSFTKKSLYRIKGYKIGKGVKFGFGSMVISKDVHVGNYTSFGFFSIVRGDTIKIGRFVKIGALSIIDTLKIEIYDDARINEQVFVGGITTPNSLFKMGKRTIIMQMSFINPVEPIIIGDDTGIGGHCLLSSHGSWLSQIEGYPVKFAPITLGKNV
jgi:acetyltransferase-like isoleucine patch superfamily enzyme